MQMLIMFGNVIDAIPTSRLLQGNAAGLKPILITITRQYTRRFTALYTIRQRYPFVFLDQILPLAFLTIHFTQTIGGFNTLNCVAIRNAPELIAHLLEERQMRVVR